MTQVFTIIKQNVNVALLMQELAPIGLNGITISVDANVQIIAADSVPLDKITTITAAILAHDGTQQTSTQQADATGRTDTANLLAAADTALTQLTSKLATFQGTPNLANAAPLLIEITQDLIVLIKAMKYIARKIT